MQRPRTQLHSPSMAGGICKEIYLRLEGTGGEAHQVTWWKIVRVTEILYDQGPVSWHHILDAYHWVVRQCMQPLGTSVAMKFSRWKSWADTGGLDLPWSTMFWSGPSTAFWAGLPWCRLEYWTVCQLSWTPGWVSTRTCWHWQPSSGAAAHGGLNKHAPGLYRNKASMSESSKYTSSGTPQSQRSWTIGRSNLVYSRGDLAKPNGRHVNW